MLPKLPGHANRSVRVRFFNSVNGKTPVSGRVKAIGYKSPGDPSKVLLAVSRGALPPPRDRQLKIKFLLSTINPADLNLIQGRYPATPIARHDLNHGSGEPASPYFVPGNEGLAEVVEVGSGKGYQKGDWVLMRKQQVGTWTNQQLVDENDVFRLPSQGPGGPGLTEVQAATLAVNPATALGMLTSFKTLESGEFIVQNGANSAVGQAVVQIAASMGVKTINFVRNRSDLDDLKEKLISLGATHVATYDDLSNKDFRSVVKNWTQGQPIRLALNCVGGKETSLMAGLLGDNAYLVSYGAMSLAPLSLPTSLFIFKNLTAHGYWQTRWYEASSMEDREKLLQTLVQMVKKGKLREPLHEIVTLQGSDENISYQIRSIMERSKEGRVGKKILLRFADE